MKNRVSGGEVFRQQARTSTFDALGISHRESRRYSLSRAMLAIAGGNKPTGYEAEVDAEVRRQRGVEGTTNSSIMVPTGMLMSRDLSVGASGGNYLVGTDNLATSFIDLLRADLVTAKMGATVLHGLRDNVTIPKQAAAATAYWLANETSAITETQQTIGQVSLSPKTVGAYTEYSRQLLLQSNPSVDAIIMNDLAKVLALGIDSAAISGTGASGQPTGLLNTAGVGAVSGTSLGYAGLVEFLTDTIAAVESPDNASFGFVTTPTVAALLMQRQRFTATDSPLWEGNVRSGLVVGLRGMTSSALPAATMIAGDWSQLLIGEWGLLELASDPYTNFKSGIIGVRAIQSIDIGFRRAGAFSVASSIT